MLQYGTITVVRHCNEQNILYNIDINPMWGLIVKDKSTIFITQNTNPGNINKYDIVNDTAEEVVEGLKKTTYIGLINIKEEYRYILQ